MMKRTADEGPDGTPLEKKVNAMVQLYNPGGEDNQ